MPPRGRIYISASTSLGVRRTPAAAILVAIVCVSFASIFIRWSGSPAFTIALYRMAFATLFLAPFLATAKGAGLRTLTGRDYLLLAGVGLALAIHFGAWILSLKLVDVATSVVLVTSHPLFVATMSHVVFRERVTRTTAFGIGLGLSGVVAIAVAQSGRGADPLLGSLLAFLGGLAAGVYLLAGRKFRQRLDLVPYAITVYAFTALFVVAFSVATATPIPVQGDVPREIALFALMAAVSQIGGHTLYNWSLRHVSATVVSTSLLGEPIGASLLAFFFLREVPGCPPGALGPCPSTTLVLVGGAVALAGIYITGREAFRGSGAG